MKARTLFIASIALLGLAPRSIAETRLNVAAASGGNGRATEPPYLTNAWINSPEGGNMITLSDEGVAVDLGSETFGAAFGFSVVLPPNHVPHQADNKHRLQLTVAGGGAPGSGTSYVDLAKPLVTLMQGCAPTLEGIYLETIGSIQATHGSEIVHSWKPDAEDYCMVTVEIHELSTDERPNAMQSDSFDLTIKGPQD